MKKYTYILFLISLFFFCACEKTLDIAPTHSLSQELAFQNMQDVEDGLAGVYSSMRSAAYYGRNMSVLPDMMSDNLTESTESLANFRLMTDWLFFSENGTVSSSWIGMYSIIADANILLDQVARFENANNSVQAARIKGQLFAIRGLVHFDLLRCFSNNFDRNSSDLGVAYVTESSLKNPFAKPSRLSTKDCYDLIIKDLEAGLDLTKKTDKPINSKNERNKLDDIGISAILARVNLYAKQYNDAIRYASAVIKARPLADNFDFPFMWEDNGVEEVAWAVYFGTGEGGRLTGDVFSQGVNRAQFDMSPDLANLYGNSASEREKDIRWASYVTPNLATAANAPRTGRFVATKYNKKSSTTTADGIVNFKAFRTGEMYLVRSESYALTAKEGDALKDLNELRATRIEDFTDGNENGAKLLEAIATERRKELWLEGHRWFDLKRTTRTINRKNCDLPATACELKANDVHWTFPIPLSEIQANPNMIQNKGY
jgi:starch-binding outer membrane protein, SusD/RagB family